MPNPAVATRLKHYREFPARYGLVPVEDPLIGDTVAFECDMASNSDWGVWLWNKNVPALRNTRAVSKSVSLGMMLRKARWRLPSGCSLLVTARLSGSLSSPGWRAPLGSG